ncbi:MAG: murein biosynthesis integral membrane protein MurJ [Rhabdochlamydiaceae bacterium]|nr:murein biosynthesis integral membrane protein MurJ [Candidatus Amphrikana amoebophyrae]
MPNKIDAQNLSHSALRFLTGTAISRVFGMIRDISMAFFFGTSGFIAAFFLAYRLSHLFRRIFAEGGLLNGFIPFFEEQKLKSDKSAHLFFRDLTASLIFILTLLIVLIECFIGVSFLVYGVNEVLLLVSIMMPSLLFICLYGLFSAYLHCQNRFFSSGVAPVIFNIVWIISAFFLRSFDLNLAVIGLSFMIVFAFGFQFLFVFKRAHSNFTSYLSLKEWLRPKLFSPEIKKMIAPFFIATIGVSAVQINGALDALFSRFASVEGPAYLSYGIRIQQLPLAFFAISIASVLLPKLSNSFQIKDFDSCKQLLNQALSGSLLFLIPSTFGILVLGTPIINLIFGHGNFNMVSVIKSSECFWAYALALIPSALVIILAPAFYAQKDYKSPTVFALIIVGINIAFNATLIFVLKLGPYSVAITTALASGLNAYFLFHKLSKQLGSFLSKSFYLLVAKVLVASILALVATLFCYQILSIKTYLPFCSEPTYLSKSTVAQFKDFSLPFFTFIFAFLSSCFLLKVYELKDFFKKTLNKY